MGKIYLAKDKKFGKQVVVKVPTIKISHKDFKIKQIGELRY